jgi:phenylpropionate dioxygenase-like ring-hydroxylating dioxygenase large terminal subunit
LSGNYWYAVEQERNLKRGEVVEVVFWKTSIALYRGEDGGVRAVENRCAHRQLSLSGLGHVEGDRLVCGYHGWKYDGCGRCVEISHDLGRGQRMPHIQIRSFPVRLKYGLVWLFPGDPGLADAVPLPSIPALDREDPWPYIPIDMTIRAHHSMIMDNVCDFNHEYLHRRYRPFADSRLERFERKGDTIEMVYRCALGQGPLVRHFAEGQSTIKIWYRYPYQVSDSNGKYLHWMFMLPMDEETTRCIFLFLLGPMRVPILRVGLPSFLRRPLIHAINRLYTGPLLLEDKRALEEEQKAHRLHAGKPGYEFNPIISAFGELTVEKWEEYRRSERERMRALRRRRERLAGLGGGIRFEELEGEGGA